VNRSTVECSRRDNTFGASEVLVLNIVIPQSIVVVHAMQDGLEACVQTQPSHNLNTIVPENALFGNLQAGGRGPSSREKLLRIRNHSFLQRRSSAAAGGSKLFSVPTYADRLL